MQFDHETEEDRRDTWRMLRLLLLVFAVGAAVNLAAAVKYSRGPQVEPVFTQGRT